MLLSVTAASMTFAQQVSENNSLIPVEGVTLPVWEHINHVAYCQERYFSILDSKGIEHVFDSSFKEIYTVQSELIDNVFYNIPYSHVIINLNVDQQQFFDNDSGTFTQKLFNDDSELEYFAFDCKVTSDGDPVVGGMVLTFDGFKIMQTNGNCIAEVKLPEESITITGNHPIRDMMSLISLSLLLMRTFIFMCHGGGEILSISLNTIKGMPVPSCNRQAVNRRRLHIPIR